MHGPAILQLHGGSASGGHGSSGVNGGRREGIGGCIIRGSSSDTEGEETNQTMAAATVEIIVGEQV